MNNVPTLQTLVSLRQKRKRKTGERLVKALVRALADGAIDEAHEAALVDAPEHLRGELRTFAQRFAFELAARIVACAR